MANVTETVHSEAWDAYTSRPLADFITELQALVDRAPLEHRSALVVNIRAEMDYDLMDSKLVVSYQRPELPEEQRSREEREARRIEDEKGRLRAQLAKLESPPQP